MLGIRCIKERLRVSSPRDVGRDNRYTRIRVTNPAMFEFDIEQNRFIQIQSKQIRSVS